MMKKILFFFVLMFAFGSLADDAHDAAQKKDWTEMFRLLRSQKKGLNTVKDGNTLLDLALSLQAPYDVRHTLIQIDGVPSCMYQDAEDKVDDTELTQNQIAIITAWFTENELDDPSPNAETPLCDGEPCVDLRELVVPNVKRSLNFGSSPN